MPVLGIEKWKVHHWKNEIEKKVDRPFWFAIILLATHYLGLTRIRRILQLYNKDIYLNLNINTLQYHIFFFFFTFVKRMVQGWRILAQFGIKRRWKFIMPKNCRKLFMLVGTGNYWIASVLLGEREMPTTPIRDPKT